MIHAASWNSKSFCHKRRGLTNRAALLIQYVMGSRGADDDPCANRRYTNTNSCGTVLDTLRLNLIASLTRTVSEPMLARTFPPVVEVLIDHRCVIYNLAVVLKLWLDHEGAGHRSLQVYVNLLLLVGVELGLDILDGRCSLLTCCTPSSDSVRLRSLLHRICFCPLKNLAKACAHSFCVAL